MTNIGKIQLDGGQDPRSSMGDVYDQFAQAFAEADQLPTWRFVGKPAMSTLLLPHVRPNARFLDLGSASARVEAGVLIPGGANPGNIVGIEISPDQVAIARQRIPDARFEVGDISDPSLLAGESGAFDVVFSHMVFEHLDDDQLRRTCANAARLLRTGGVFAFVVTHPDKMTGLQGNLVTTYGEFITTAPWGGELHNWRRRVSDTKNTVEDAGFTIETVNEIPFPSLPPQGLDDASIAAFAAAATKYRRYPAIRLAISARKT